jgi:hypothetical protein
MSKDSAECPSNRAYIGNSVWFYGVAYAATSWGTHLREGQPIQVMTVSLQVGPVFCTI